MVGICFFFEDVVRNTMSGIVGADIERAIFDARNLGATHVLLVDATQYGLSRFYGHSDSQIVFERYETLEQAEATYPDVPRVYLENEATLLASGTTGTPLAGFVHPASAIYVVGKDAGGGITTGRKQKTWVYMPYANLWASSTLAIILHDRRAKSI